MDLTTPVGLRKIKKKLAGIRVLTSYNVSFDFYLATDASEYGLGAVSFYKHSANLGQYGTKFGQP